VNLKKSIVLYQESEMYKRGHLVEKSAGWRGLLKNVRLSADLYH
jgi:hypothetical protein